MISHEFLASLLVFLNILVEKKKRTEFQQFQYI